MSHAGQKRDRFIVFEGIDGAGTTTQTRRLTERLRAHAYDVWQTSEPTSRPIGRLIRDVLSGSVVVSPDTIAHLFAADRSDHLYSPGGIVERLAGGQIVVCDRYKYSSLAYQALDTDAELVRSLNERFDDPGLLFYLDLPVSVSETRIAGRAHREIYERIEFQERVRTRYLEVLAAAAPSVRVYRLDGTQPEDLIAEKIWVAVMEASIL